MARVGLIPAFSNDVLVVDDAEFRWRVESAIDFNARFGSYDDCAGVALVLPALTVRAPSCGEVNSAVLEPAALSAGHATAE